jgi:hypothetical protein
MSSWARVLELLDTYGVESYERERERVQLDILKLSAGSEEKVREYVGVAKRDYRDVLFWAEYPEEIEIRYARKAPTGEKDVREIRDRTADRSLTHKLREIKAPLRRAPARNR